MSTDLVLPALRELPVLLVLGWGGVGLLTVGGMTRPLLIGGSAPIAYTALALAVFPFAKWFSIAPFVPVVALSFFLGVGALLIRRTRASFLQAFLIVFGISILGWGLRWVVAIPERVGEDAILVMLQSVLDIQSGNSPSDPRRGLAYPMIIGLSEPGTILSSLTPVISLSLVALVLCFGNDLLGTIAGRTKTVILVLSGAVIVSTPIFWIAVVYTNSHTLLGLAITAIAGSILTSSLKLSRTQELNVLLILGLFVGATSRFEGALLGLCAIFPALLSPGSFPTPKTRLWLLGIAPFLGFAYWTSIVSIEAVRTEAAISFVVLALAPILTDRVMARLGVRRERLAHNAGWAVFLLAPVVILALKWQPEAGAILFALSLNLLLGVGGWGGLISATLLTSGIAARRPHDRVVKMSLQIFYWGALATLSLKLIDSPPGGLGFNDSVVRTMLHWIGPLAFTWVLALKLFLAERLKFQSPWAWRQFRASRFGKIAIAALSRRNRFAG